MTPNLHRAISTAAITAACAFVGFVVGYEYDEAGARFAIGGITGTLFVGIYLESTGAPQTQRFTSFGARL